MVIGLVATAAGVALAMAGSSQLWNRTGGRPFVPLGAVVFVAVYPVWAYATSGLETGLVFAWLGACMVILARWARRPPRRMVAWQVVIVGLGWLVRPEMALFSAAFVILVVAGQWHTESEAERARTIAAAVALPVAYQLFRMGYFGSLIANTAIAKEGTGGNVDRGWAYFRDFVGPYWLWVPLLALAVAGYLPLLRSHGRPESRRRVAVIGAFVGCAVLNTGYVVLVGGDYHHGRMFLPALFALCAPVAVVPLARRHLVGLVVAGWAVAAALTLRPDQLEGDNWLAHGFLAPQEFGTVTRDDYGWGDGSEKLAWYTGPGYYYQDGIGHYPRADMELADGLPLPFGAFWGIGVSGYSVGTDFHVLDELGLADVLTAHFEGRPSLHPILPRFPGHEKPLPAVWLAARVTPPGTSPDPDLFPSFGNPLIPPTTGEAFREQVVWARAALRCHDIELLVDERDGTPDPWPVPVQPDALGPEHVHADPPRARAGLPQVLRSRHACRGHGGAG